MTIGASYSLHFPTPAGHVRYQMTDDDVLTLGRATNHEGPPLTSTVWAYLQRFAHVWPAYTKLSALVRAHSQTINPRWFPDGQLHLRAIHDVEQNTSLAPESRAQLIQTLTARAERRVRQAAEGWSDIREAAKHALFGVLDGSAENHVAGAIDFRASLAAPGESDGHEAALRFISEHPQRHFWLVDSRAGYGHGVNVFFGVPQTRDWATDHVKVERGAPVSGVPKE